MGEFVYKMTAGVLGISGALWMVLLLLSGFCYQNPCTSPQGKCGSSRLAWDPGSIQSGTPRQSLEACGDGCSGSQDTLQAQCGLKPRRTSEPTLFTDKPAGHLCSDVLLSEEVTSLSCSYYHL